MKDCAITHNHPNNSCFSTADIAMLKKTHASEMRASTKFGTYVINPPDKWDKDILSFKQIEEELTPVLIKQYTRSGSF